MFPLLSQVQGRYPVARTKAPIVTEVNGRQGDRSSPADRFTLLSGINETFDGPDYSYCPTASGEEPSDPLDFLDRRKK